MEQKKLNNPYGKMLTAFLILPFLFGILITVLLWYAFPFADSFLFNISIGSGINPSLMIFLLFFALIGISLSLLYYSKKCNSYSLLPVVFFLIAFSITNVACWCVNGLEFNIRELNDSQTEKYLLYTCEDEGYVYIGKALGNDMTTGESVECFLFLQTIEGKKYYYCSFKPEYHSLYTNYLEKYLVEKYKERYGFVNTKDGAYVFTMEFDWDQEGNKGRSTSKKKNKEEIDEDEIDEDEI